MDGQFGSTGKGALNAYLAHRRQYDICVSNAAPNAGHTFDLADGKGKRTTFHLPITGVMNKDALIYLCAGAIIDPELLAQELVTFGVHPSRVIVHPRAAILLPEHAAQEKAANSGATGLGSTQKGVGASLAAKVARQKGVVLAKDYYGVHKTDMTVMALDLAAELELKRGIMEVPQGFDLSLNYGLAYPYCTSRDITVASALNDAGLHPSFLGEVMVSLRTFPIRVGHIYDDQGNQIGDSGPFWPDSIETTWGELGLPEERTTVTKRVRRVATWSNQQYENMLRTLRPDGVFMNFMNYYRTPEEVNTHLKKMAYIEDKVGIRPEYLFSWGPTVKDVSPEESKMRQEVTGVPF